jgi:hypothetical protein
LPQIDLDIDSDNNNGFDLPDENDYEDSIEDIADDPEKPGKIIMVNDGDSNGNGIPNYADGFLNQHFDHRETDPDPEVPAGGRFVPLVLKISNNHSNSSSGPNQLKVRFTYSASDPDEIGLSGPVPPGHLRIWTLDGSEDRDAASIHDQEPGDFISPGVVYDLTLLEQATDQSRSKIILYVEAVRVSTEVADQRILVELGTDDGNGGFCPVAEDAVRLTVLDLRLLEIDSDEQLHEVKELRYSEPSPIIEVTECLISNFTWDHSEQRIRGDVHVKGKIKSTVCDITPGTDGEINQAAICVNEDFVFSNIAFVSVTKQQTSSLLRPYEFEGAFQTTFSSLLAFGDNLIRVLAFDKVFDVTGYADHIVEVTGQPPGNILLDLQLNLTGVSIDGPAIEYPSSLQATIAANGGSASTETLNNSASAPSTFKNAAGTFKIDFPNVPSFIYDEIDLLEVVVTHDGIGISNRVEHLAEDDLNSKIFFIDHEAENYEGWNITAAAAEPIGASDGGTFHPMVIEAQGPPALLQNVDFLKTLDGDRKLKQIGGHYLMGARDSMSNVNAVHAVLLARPNPDEGSSLFPQMPQNGFVAFHAGCILGFVKGGYGLVEGTAIVLKHSFRMATLGGIAYVMLSGDKYESEKTLLADLQNNLEPLARFAWSLREKEINALLSMFQGDFEGALAGYSEIGRSIVAIGKEAIAAVQKQYVTSSDFERGEIVGRLCFELATLIVPYVKGAQIGQVNKVSKLKVLDDLADTAFAQGKPKVQAGIATAKQAVLASEDVDTIHQLIACANLAHKRKKQGAIESMHKLFEREVKNIGRADIFTEVGYRGGIMIEAPWGKNIAGGKRIDSVKGTKSQPLMLMDLKLTTDYFNAERVARYRKNLPDGYQQKPIVEIRLDRYRVWEGSGGQNPTAWILVELP